MSTSYASRSQQIDFAAHAAKAWGMSGPQSRRLMRLAAAYRRQHNDAEALTSLKRAVVEAAPPGVSVGFSATLVWLDGISVP